MKKSIKSKIKRITREEVKKQLKEDFESPVGKRGQFKIQDADPDARRVGYVCRISMNKRNSYLTREQVHQILDNLEQYA